MFQIRTSTAIRTLFLTYRTLYVSFLWYFCTNNSKANIKMVVRKANFNNNDLHKRMVFNNGELMFVDSLREMNVPSIIKNEIWILILVLDGQATFSLNEETYKAAKNDVFICLPNTIIEDCMTSVNFKCHCVGMSSAYMIRNFPVIDNSWDIMELFSKHPLISLTEKEAEVFCQYYNLLCSKIHLPSVVQEKVINTLMLAFFYDLQHILGRTAEFNLYNFTSKEYHLKKFIEIIQKSYPKKRRVDYYANLLNITPKYFSTICKELTGNSPSHIIDKYVMKDIENLMKNSTKSIKEIANELEFPTISFFGKYMRSHYGVSPKEYRRRLNDK